MWFEHAISRDVVNPEVLAADGAVNETWESVALRDSGVKSAVCSLNVVCSSKAVQQDVDE